MVHLYWAERVGLVSEAPTLIRGRKGLTGVVSSRFAYSRTMNPPQNRMGCYGLVAIMLFLYLLIWSFLRVSGPSVPDHVPGKKIDRLHSEEEIGPEFTTMDAQLALAKEKRQKVTSIYLEGTPTPLIGQWSVQEVGFDVVVLNDPAGVLTLKIESIVGIQVKEVKKPSEPPVEK